MGKETGFIEYERKTGNYRDPIRRINHFDDIYIPLLEEEIQVQGSRCMDCGVPFCSYSCPLGNLIPEFNDLVYKGHWKKALEILHLTNNFPEFTGKICPAPCESGCVLGIIKPPITIEQIELAIIEKGFREGWVKPEPPAVQTGKKIAIIGSGPSGLAAAQQLRRVGHEVVVFERADRIGGCLRYGIPDYKLPKVYIDRRVKQMEAEGIVFKTNANVGVNIDVKELKEKFDVICLTGGSTLPRDLMITGRGLKGIYFATEFLPQANKRVADINIEPDLEIIATGKRVVVIGGGDTGSDCVGTSLRQGAIDVTQLELLPMPPLERDPSQPWPVFPRLHKASSSHIEAEAILEKDIRNYCIATKSFEGEEGAVKRLSCIKVEWIKSKDGSAPKMKEIEGSEFIIEAELVLFAMGFLHPEHSNMLTELGVVYDQRGNVKTNDRFETGTEGVFSAGDMRRGQSLVVHAISEGRRMAASVDCYLMGETSLR